MLQSFFRWIASFFQKQFPLRIDAAAAQEILKIIAEQKVGPKWRIRFLAEGDVIRGYSVGMGFVAEPEPDDYLLTVRGVPLAIDRKSLPVFRDMDINFFEGEGRRGFTFRSPLLTPGQ